MSLYHLMENQFVKPTIRRHEARATKANNAEWREWLNRKDAAEKAGLPFNEPDPEERVRKASG